MQNALQTFWSTIKPYTYTSLVWIAALLIAWGFLYIDGAHNSIPYATPDQPAHTQTASSSVSVDLSGIENPAKLEERIRIMVDKQRARETKEDAQNTLEQLQRKQTSLE